MNTKVKNTLDGRAKGPAASAVFNPRTVILMIVIGVFSFGAYFVLAGFADKFKSGNNGAAHVLSKSAIGYAGLMHLLKEDKNSVEISRSPILISDNFDTLRIVSLPRWEHEVDLEELKIGELGGSQSTLVILPKWNVRPLQKHKGWVEKRNTPASDVIRESKVERSMETLVEGTVFSRRDATKEKITVHKAIGLGAEEDLYFYEFSKLQTISGGELTPIIVTDKGTILAKIVDTNTYILSDPDFVNTQGVAKADRAEFALEMLYLIEEQASTSGFVFDLSLHGFARSQNFIKLALTPPFLAVTLCLLAMAMLIAWQAVARFGSPTHAGREIALGKLSLIYNAANFIKRAGREYKMGPEYLHLTKTLATEQLHLPRTLSDAEQTQRLDAYGKHMNTDISWSELERALKSPTNATELMKGARKLFKWRQDITHKNTQKQSTMKQSTITQSTVDTKYTGDKNAR